MNLSSLSGMHAAALLLDVSADNTANLDTPGYAQRRVDLATQTGGGVSASVSAASGPGVDLAEQVVNLMTASVVYQANAQVLRTTADTEQRLFDERA